ncbi:DsbA family protein [Candidatus Enterococcus ferrettii]|uniref:Dithiol-disulfide isomerase n=1 Tax=Candidatus Enterococcus ferrettii TaxID=2815324 RepID=A0ABV0EZP6_9ENTE|nr:DsbA family protein [Enterococcus sp. 665A]MBO1338788.1 DsbA family protein [Enterococcus sp. 665A]
MIEIYLFINPIGDRCLNIEKQITELMKKNDLKIQLRLIPLMNLHTVSDLLIREGLSKKDIRKRNKLSDNIYSAALDVKAAQLQGKKRGRIFLMKLQEELTKKKTTYSEELVYRLFSEVGGDMETFIEDRASDLVKELFIADQQIARDMNITKHPSAVIYNCANDAGTGVRVEGFSAIKYVINACKSRESMLRFFKTQENSEIFSQDFPDDHLSLI